MFTMPVCVVGLVFTVTMVVSMPMGVAFMVVGVVIMVTLIVGMVIIKRLICLT